MALIIAKTDIFVDNLCSRTDMINKNLNNCGGWGQCAAQTRGEVPGNCRRVPATVGAEGQCRGYKKGYEKYLKKRGNLHSYLQIHHDRPSFIHIFIKIIKIHREIRGGWIFVSPPSTEYFSLLPVPSWMSGKNCLLENKIWKVFWKS